MVLVSIKCYQFLSKTQKRRWFNVNTKETVETETESPA